MRITLLGPDKSAPPDASNANRVAPDDMSSQAQPISTEAFATSLESLTIDVLHAKAAEIRNSIQHMKDSNEQMVPFAEAGDQDCKDALYENLVVLGRMNERVALLRAEVERRGMRWAEAEDEDAAAVVTASDEVNGNANGVNGVNGGNSQTQVQPQRASGSNGRLTDAELEARLRDRIGELDDDGDGVHL